MNIYMCFFLVWFFLNNVKDVLFIKKYIYFFKLFLCSIFINVFLIILFNFLILILNIIFRECCIYVVVSVNIFWLYLGFGFNMIILF